jgi:hypothetical protein
MLYKGLDAGEQSWSLTHPELREIVDKNTATTCWDHPTHLREDAAAGVIVAVSGLASKACVAFRREPFVEPARNITIVHRLLAAAIVTASILLAALVARAVRRA